MKGLMLCAMLLLVGCGEGAEIIEAKAQYACRDKGGMHHWRYKLGEPYVVCANGEGLEGIKTLIIADPEYYAKPGD